MELNTMNIIIISLLAILISIIAIGVSVAIQFQRKQKKKYDECINIIKDKKDTTFQIKDGLTEEEINKIDNQINVAQVMNDLYNKYLELESKIKLLDENLDNVVTGYLKDFYINKIKNFKETRSSEVKDGIDLINYSIVEFNKESLKFRITINCFCYKLSDNQIVSGSNFEKQQQILLLTYEKINDNWLISSIEKIYEKKLSD